MFVPYHAALTFLLLDV